VNWNAPISWILEGILGYNKPETIDTLFNDIFTNTTAPHSSFLVTHSTSKLWGNPEEGSSKKPESAVHHHNLEAMQSSLTLKFQKKLGPTKFQI